MAAQRENGVIVPVCAQPFLTVDDSVFYAETEATIERFLTIAAKEEAEALYRAEILPREYERVRREAANRPEPPLKLLFVTVGAQADSPALAVEPVPVVLKATIARLGSP